ncbi:FtsX-like permease family protein [Candidatus Blochmannia ocreatus (nom. nud.)]|uniref:FtsX-like permease family protein n=1 Tax=Candidatus Blochmannia ocreatus (nom. nud.) TaxID=251538 RepID=A0ABY4SVT6_9ENTR|nr:FtsX-like permease family protein [Candidatus Blochmannia ocreatus]URJ24901.1 FtsX-like permease family protein [Candidatus Blochmannia ocreatus]
MARLTVLFTIALRYVWGKSINKFSRYIYWTSGFAVALGVMAMIVVSSVLNGFENEFKKDLLNFIPHILLTNLAGYVSIVNKPSVIFNDLNNEVSLKPLVISNVILQSNRQLACGIMLGIDPNNCEPLSDYIDSKYIRALVLGKYYIIIGSSIAKALGVCVNDQIRLIVPSVIQITPIGCIPSQRLFTVLNIYTDITEEVGYSDRILVNYSDAAVLMHYPFQCITGWHIWLHDPFLIYKKNYLGFSKDWIYKDWKEYKGSLFQAIKIEKNIMSLLLSIIIVTASFNIIAFLVLLISEKQIEIAVLRTYGITRVQILLIFIIQGMSNGVFGIILGTGLGIFLAKNLNQILYLLRVFPAVYQLPIELWYFQVLSIIFMTFSIIFLVTLYPAWKAASVYPAKILRYD